MDQEKSLIHSFLQDPAVELTITKDGVSEASLQWPVSVWNYRGY